MGPSAAGKLPALTEDTFAGRVAVVSGGSGGIGAAICAALVGHGATVASLARTVTLSKVPWHACTMGLVVLH